MSAVLPFSLARPSRRACGGGEDGRAVRRDVSPIW